MRGDPVGAALLFGGMALLFGLYGLVRWLLADAHFTKGESGRKSLCTGIDALGRASLA